MKHKIKKRGSEKIKEDGYVKALESELREVKMKCKSLKIDKGIIMKMIKNMIEKFPENVGAIDHELFLKTLDDQ